MQSILQKFSRNWDGNPSSPSRRGSDPQSAGTLIIRNGCSMWYPGNICNSMTRITKTDDFLTTELSRLPEFCWNSTPHRQPWKEVKKMITLLLWAIISAIRKRFSFTYHLVWMSAECPPLPPKRNTHHQPVPSIIVRNSTAPTRRISPVWSTVPLAIPKMSSSANGR